MNPEQSPVNPPNQTEQSGQPTQPVTPEAVATNVPPQAPGTQAPQVKKSRKKPIIIAAIVLFILILGGSAAAYRFVYLPNTPENVLLQGLYNTTSQEEVKSAKIDGTLRVSGGTIPEQLGDIDVTASLAESGDLAATVSTDFSGTTVSAEYRQIGENEAYVKLNGTKDVDKIAESFNVTDPETLQLIEIFAPLLRSVDDQWIQLDETSDQVAGGGDDALSILDLSQEDADKVAEAYLDNPVLKITEVLEDEDVNNEPSYHYRVVVDKDSLVAFLTAVKDANIEGVNVEQSDIDSAKDADVSKLNTEIWINKSTKIINQIKLSGEEDGVKLELRVAVTNVNQEVIVEKPTEVEKFEDIFSSYLGTASGGGSPLVTSSGT